MGWVVRSEDQVIENIHTEDFEVDITYVYYWGIIYYIFELCTHLLGFLSYFHQRPGLVLISLHVLVHIR